jgi:hypothetical protein
MPDKEAGLVTGCTTPAVVGSEFAEVTVAVDTSGNGPRVRLEDRRTGRVRYLDALELETIIWLPEGHLRRLLDPSADRWREDTGE